MMTENKQMIVELLDEYAIALNERKILIQYFKSGYNKLR